MSRRIPTVVPVEKKSATPDVPKVLPNDCLESVEAWGMADSSMSYVFRPTTVKQIGDVFDLARRTGRTIGPKGGGRCYGDAFQNAEGITLDLGRMNRILSWDPENGIVETEPGVRLADLWRYIIGDGWWPTVVSGTMFTTIGGCLGMNIHGKNAYEVGPFGNCVEEFDLLTPDGTSRTVTRENDPVLFHGAISGFGQLGVMTRIKLRTKKIYSGLMKIEAKRTRDFDEMIDAFEERADTQDYMVGWVDCFPMGKNLGRGEMHFATHFEPGEDPAPAQTLRVDAQELPDTFFGILPKSIMHLGMKPILNDFGMRALNFAKYLAQLRPGAAKPYTQSHAEFAFLLDYIPNWKQAYAPGGLIQYQSFVPKRHAAKVFAEQIRLSARRGIYPYLGVTKKHITDDFLISHGVDGYSLALDYPVTAANHDRLWKLCYEMDEVVLAAGGRFYFAKDSTMRPGTAQRYLPKENLEKFFALKNQCDPTGMLSSNLYRRLFPQGAVTKAVGRKSLRAAG